MRLSLLICAIAATNLCSVAKAEIVTDPVRVVALVKANQPGAWFDLEAMKKALLAEKTVETQTEQLRLFGDEVLTLKLSIETQKEKILNLEKENILLISQTDDYRKLNKELEYELSRWYRNPLVVSLATAGAVAIVMSVASVAIYAATR